MSDIEPTQAEIDAVKGLFDTIQYDAVASQSAYIVSKRLKRIFNPVLTEEEMLRMAILNNTPRKELTDVQVATHIRAILIELNQFSEEAAKRELIVAYRIKDGQKTDGLTNPRIIVSVMTEVT